MLHRITVLGGDLRQKYLTARLLAGGFPVENYHVPGLSDSAASLHAALQNAEAVVLPMPALTADGQIRAQNAPIPLISVLESLPAEAIVFGGPFAPAADVFARYPVTLRDYSDSPALAAANAVPTAEGALLLAMEHLPITLWRSRCLVVGFGRIGKVLCDRLRALGAHVTAAARRPEDRALAEALGFTPEHTGRYCRGLAQYDCVFNTVPAPVFSGAQLAAMRSDCLLLDLASAPGGLSPDIGRFDAPVYLRAPGLPGKTSPATAAELLYAHIHTTLAAPARG